jgi:hypothetical protein
MSREWTGRNESLRPECKIRKMFAGPLTIQIVLVLPFQSELHLFHWTLSKPVFQRLDVTKSLRVHMCGRAFPKYRCAFCQAVDAQTLVNTCVRIRGCFPEPRGTSIVGFTDLYEAILANSRSKLLKSFHGNFSVRAPDSSIHAQFDWVSSTCQLTRRAQILLMQRRLRSRALLRSTSSDFHEVSRSAGPLKMTSLTIVITFCKIHPPASLRSDC